MKKLISILSLTVGLLVSATAFVACGSNDDDSTEDNSSGKQSSKRIIKIVEEDEHKTGEKEERYISEISLSYDSQGRIVKIVGETNSSAGGNSSTVITYQYGETLIISKKETKETDSNGQSFSSSILHSYTLDKGRIIKDEKTRGSSSETITYSYDANGQLASILRSGSNINSYTVTWSNGNISSIGDVTFTSSNYSWVKGLPLQLEGSYMDNFLFSMGYYGNFPHNLISSYKRHYSNRDSTYGSTYDYTLQDGLVTKVVETYVNDNKYYKVISTVTWE